MAIKSTIYLQLAIYDYMSECYTKDSIIKAKAAIKTIIEETAEELLAGLEGLQDE